MCFSPEASFTMGALLGVIGGLCVKRTKNKSRVLIACIPFLFAMQQFSEGVVWLTVNSGTKPSFFGSTAAFFFLLFAWVLWPVYVPLSFYISEIQPWKKIVCVLSFLLGLVLAYFDLSFLCHKTVAPSVVGNSVYYLSTTIYENILYSFAVLPPVLISSIPRMWLFGCFLLASFIITQVVWNLTFTSVWCFFAAAASIILLQVLGNEQKDRQ